MSVLVKDMEMPKSCRKCCLCDFDRNGYYCVKLEKVLDKRHVRTHRDYDCPLIEVPSDIDLIDKNKLYEKVAEWEAQALEQASKLAQTDNVEEWRRWSTILNERTAFKFDVIDAPVIIPAE